MPRFNRISGAFSTFLNNPIAELHMLQLRHRMIPHLEVRLRKRVCRRQSIEGLSICKLRDISRKHVQQGLAERLFALLIEDVEGHLWV